MKRVLTVILVTLLTVVVVSCAQQEVMPSETPAPSEPPELSESAAPSPEASTQPPESAQPEETAGMANPWKTVADALEVEDITGLAMSPLPEGASDVVYSVMESDKTAQAIFTWDGDVYTYRMIAGDPETDISGMFVEFENTEDTTWEDYPFTVSYNEGKEGKADWYDKDLDAKSSVTMSQGATRAKMVGIVKTLIPMG